MNYVKNLKKTSICLFYLLFFFFTFSITSCEKGTSEYKDFEVAIIGTDYAKVEIRNYPDSTYVTSETYDAEFVQSLHFTKLTRGKYYIIGYCPYSSLKNNTVYVIIDFPGHASSCALYFEKKY